MEVEQFDFYIETIRDNLMDEALDKTNENIDNIFFKLNKSNYHFCNMKKVISSSNTFSKDYSEDVDFDEIYYEMESFIISVRSTVDLLMHLLNDSLELKVGNKDVTLSSIYQSNKLPNRVKNVLYQFSHNRDNTIWDFIYQTRNIVVHATSIKEIHPVTFSNVDTHTILASVEVQGKDKELVNFFSSCLNFLERFFLKILESINFILKNSND